jgi:ABC-type uncharacterized transport system ATPase subunit
VIIINQGKLVAQDTVTNLTNRLRGSESVAVEIQTSNGNLNHADVRQRLEQVAGVSRVVLKDTRTITAHSKWRACKAVRSAPN